MKTEGTGQLLRIFIGEADRWEGKPLYEAIVLKAREAGLAGATVTRGFLGYGANSHIRTTKILSLSQDLPVVVEIVDESDKIEALLPQLDGMLSKGMMTLEKMTVVMYRSNGE